VTIQATERLRRLLAVIPLFADSREVTLNELERRTGVDAETLLDDLRAVTERQESEPPGFIESVGVTFEHDRVAIRSSHFLRPLRLTATELCALELGLAVLGASLPPDERRAVDQARQRIRKVIVKLPSDPDPDDLWHSAAPPADPGILAALRASLRDRRKARITYQRGGDVTSSDRVVRPYALLPIRGSWYLVGHCDHGTGLRFFRVDRIVAVVPTDEQFRVPRDFAVQSLMINGKPFQAAATRTLTVRYSPAIARWIAERERVPLASDGSLTLDHPLADEQWAVRHVLQYGPDAEVLAPESVRVALRERLAALAQELAVA
jgi:predicted DNA-binding transcriptional regulator YafY